ncbi:MULTISPECIES: CIA30 family protein [Rubrivirga]|uniref:CIA30 family protein n=1 Tax=Rubrivirga litoralis TaxID=3075598 RepID=A0ABU3BLF0_9BACT|nr:MULTISPECIES: CIA30 family protein [unclassified Rubrivirga]MDT0630119.1 CIA30 family protein [Rubrivirga sp. F394]
MSSTARLLAGLVAFAACAAPPDATPPAPPAPTEGGAAADTAPPAMPDSTRPLFSFDADADPWTVQNDGVMGGDSRGSVSIEGGALVFTGDVVTEGGGFTSVLKDKTVDLSDAAGLALRVRGGGRTFEVEVDDGTRDGRGRQVSRRAPFETTDKWRTVRVPWGAFESSVFGEPVDAAPLDPAAVQAFGLYIIDGQDGPFRLEVDWIGAYGER